jgi:hypothetical protein
MNVSKNSKKQGKRFKSKLSTKLVIYTSLVITIYFIQILSIYGIWSNRLECIKYNNEWYTETTNEYQVLNKLQEHSDSGTKNWMLLKNTKTGRVFKLDVTAETYMTKGPRDYVWFTLSKSQEYNNGDVPDSPMSFYFDLAWGSLFVYLLYLFIIFDIDYKFVEIELNLSKIKQLFLVLLPIFTTVGAILNGIIFCIFL